MKDKERIHHLELQLKVKNEQITSCVMLLEQLKFTLKKDSFFYDMITNLVNRIKL